MTAKAKTTEVALAPAPKARLLSVFAERYDLESATIPEMLRKTAFPDAKSNAELMAMLTVANAYQLNPFVREIYAFMKDGRVMPVVSIDGWLRVINDHPQFDGMEIAYAEKLIKKGNSLTCPEWIEVTIYRKDRSRPTTVREYFEECYRSTPPWNATPRRMLRHRAIIQTGRVAFGLSFIDPEDEARIKGEIIDAIATEEPAEPTSNAARAREALGATPTPPEPSNAPEEAPVAAEAVIDEETGEVLEGTIEERPDDAEDGVSEEDAEIAELDALVETASKALDAVVERVEEGEQGTLA